jgi:hypothetical protein
MQVDRVKIQMLRVTTARTRWAEAFKGYDDKTHVVEGFTEIMPPRHRIGQFLNRC